MICFLNGLYDLFQSILAGEPRVAHLYFQPFLRFDLLLNNQQKSSQHWITGPECFVHSIHFRILSDPVREQLSQHSRVVRVNKIKKSSVLYPIITINSILVKYFLEHFLGLSIVGDQAVLIQENNQIMLTQMGCLSTATQIPKQCHGCECWVAD